MPNAAWQHFHHPLVRDLAFALACPPLLRDWPADIQQQHAIHQHIDLPDTAFWQQHFLAYLPRLQQLEQQPQPLEQALAQRASGRLGFYFEALLAFWLHDRDYHDFELLGRNLQRIEQQNGQTNGQQRTVGEIDFLLFNHTKQQVEHWEVSLKFYLGDAPFRPDCWHGLNHNDHLGRKLNHLCAAQFSPSHALGLPIGQRRAIIKGRLFWPTSDATIRPAVDLPWLNPAHLRGTWAHDLPDLAQGQYWRRAARVEALTERTHGEPDLARPFGSAGLYLQCTASGAVQQRHMLRLAATV